MKAIATVNRPPPPPPASVTLTLTLSQAEAEALATFFGNTNSSTVRENAKKISMIPESVNDAQRRAFADLQEGIFYALADAGVKYE